MATKIKNTYFIVEDKDRNDLLCPLDGVKNRDAVTDQELDECVEKVRARNLTRHLAAVLRQRERPVRRARFRVVEHAKLPPLRVDAEIGIKLTLALRLILVERRHDPELTQSLALVLIRGRFLS